MKAFLVGRSKDCDIVIDDPTVSRRHAELIAHSEVEFLLIDRNSTSGTFLRHKGEWRRVTSMRVGIDDQVRLGQHETSVSRLVDAVRAELPPARKAGPAAKGPIERDPETGEIIDPRGG